MTDGPDQMNRRKFLKVLGVTGAGAATLSACGIGPEPTEKLIPYLVQPEDQIPGTATYYASTGRECAAGCGIHVRVREGRALKIEGNPESPINAGRLCARGQAALQGLYTPDRIKRPMARNAAGGFDTIGWDEAIKRVQEKLAAARGHGIVFLTGSDASTFGDLVDDWMRQAGGRRVSYEAFGFEALRAGNRLAFGTAAVPSYDFANAKYVLSFGADFLDTWLSPVAFQNGFSRAHAFDGGRDGSMAKFVFAGPRTRTSPSSRRGRRRTRERARSRSGTRPARARCRENPRRTTARTSRWQSRTRGRRRYQTRAGCRRAAPRTRTPHSSRGGRRPEL